MKRKVILSFIGTGSYKPCKYRSEALEKTSPVVTFVQTAITNFYGETFVEGDRVFIFETEKAKENHSDELTKELKTVICSDFVEFVAIPDGLTEESSWEIFSIVASKIQEGDEIVLDITHGFRSLPMLAMVLLDFLKTTKSIEVNDIIYGAFENLGSAHTIETRIPNPEDRIAPLVSYLNYSVMQEWSQAARNFKKYGVYSDISKLSSVNIQNRLRVSRGGDEVAKDLRLFGKYLQTLISAIQFNRSKELIAYNWSDLDELLTKLSKIDTGIQPINDLMGVIEKKIDCHFNVDYPIWLKSAGWCLEHELIQEGFTQLQEGIITHFSGVHDELLKSMANERMKRGFISSVLNVVAKNIEKSLWQENLKNNEKLTKDFINLFSSTQWPQIYSDLSASRNDINHSGMVDNPMQPERLKEKLIHFIKLVKEELSKSCY